MTSHQQSNHAVYTHSILTAKLHPEKPGIEFQFKTKQSIFKGCLAVNIEPITGILDRYEYDLLSTAALLVVAGMFTPSQIVIHWPSNAVKYTEFNQLLQILYDIRAYCARTSFLTPLIEIDSSNNVVISSTFNTFSQTELAISTKSNYTHLLLLSGGIDSTYSLLRLLEDGYKPLALFLGVNTDTIELEWKASRNIATKMNVNLLRCDIEMKGLPRRGSDPAIWPQFGQFPYYNSIPHGRDILSAAIATVIAKRLDISSIAFGQEKESREKIIIYQKRRILRHDVESYEGARILNTWLNYCSGYKIKLISPIEYFTIEEIRTNMIRHHPDLLSMTQSCFWERLCCKCVKCISLYILQRITGITVIHFPANPLADPENQDLADAINNKIPENEIGYGAQIRNGIKKIIENHKYTKQDYWILRAIKKGVPAGSP